MSETKTPRSVTRFADELTNFEEIAQAMNPLPGSIPALDGIELYGEVLPLNGVVGGDYFIYMDFKKRYDLDARIRSAQAEGRTGVARNLEDFKPRAALS